MKIDQIDETVDPADEAGARLYAARVYVHDSDLGGDKRLPVTVMTDGKHFLSLAVNGYEVGMSSEVARTLARALTHAADLIDR